MCSGSWLNDILCAYDIVKDLRNEQRSDGGEGAMNDPASNPDMINEFSLISAFRTSCDRQPFGFVSFFEKDLFTVSEHGSNKDSLPLIE